MRNEKILISIDADSSGIFEAISEFEDYEIEIAANPVDADLILDDNFGLIITSYPYDTFIFDEIRQCDIPVILLSDHIDGNLICILEGLQNSYCMITPFDYQKFRALIRQVMSGGIENIQDGYCIV